MNIRTRQATINDAEAIVNVHTTTWKYSYKGFIPDEELAKKNLTPERILKMQEAIEQQLFYVAEVDNQIVAFSGLHGQLGSTSEIGLMYVLPQYQGLGIGRRLFQDFLNTLKHKDCEKVEVWTMKKSPQSVNFYKNMGGFMTNQDKEWKYGLTVTQFIFDLKG